MACSSLVALPRACGAEGVMGGLEAVYMLAYIDASTGVTTDSGYTITSFGVDTGKTFVQIGILKSSSGIQETLTKDVTKGIAYFTQTFTLVLSNITTANRVFVQSVLNQPVVVLVKARTGNFYLAGANGQLELSASEGGLGTAEGDMNGYTLTFTSVDTASLRLVEAQLAASLTA